MKFTAKIWESRQFWLKFSKEKNIQAPDAKGFFSAKDKWRRREQNQKLKNSAILSQNDNFIVN